MDESPLYEQIAESIRRQILEGRLKPGDRLPSVRQLTTRWNCTPGTVQRAYQELSRQGLVVSRTGQGTHVAGDLPGRKADNTPLRRAALVHRAEAFLLEALAAGHSAQEIEDAVRQAVDRWHAVSLSPEPQGPETQTLRFVGSHDPAIGRIASEFDRVAPGWVMDTTYTGSLGGLMALAEGRADVAGSHLWDAESGEYNRPFVRRLLPGRRVALLTLAARRLGLILPAGNPQGLRELRDLSQPGVRFANRQPGSGTRVWLDASLLRLGVEPAAVEGYLSCEKLTHSDVARAVATGEANAGLGLESAAASFGLDFIFLTEERYDLVIPAEKLDLPPVRALAAWLQGDEARHEFESLGGYTLENTGQVEWVNP